MASLLRQIVAGPRTRHPEAGLDLCYVTDHIIATSGPSQTYPQLAYRNPLDQLVKFLDSKHGQEWAIWEFRAEGTGYPDEAVYGRVRHYPWPDHHPPPFRLLPMIMASMRNWLHGGDIDGGRVAEDGRRLSFSGSLKKMASGAMHHMERKKKRVVVVHCKAGKGRSGTISCSYLISEEGWKPEDALARFTERRMRPKFGAGVSIPSQLRWISYVERWTHGNKKYFDRPIEIVEIHAWGLRNGVKIDVEGFVDEGKRIEIFHTFKKEERIVVQGDAPDGNGITEMMWEMAGYGAAKVSPKVPEGAHFADGTNLDDESADKESGKKDELKSKGSDLLHNIAPAPSTPPVDKPKAKTITDPTVAASKADPIPDSQESEPGGMAVILKPKEPILIPNSDVNIAVERRNKTHRSMGLTMVTAVAHVWFNSFFEGNGPEQQGKPDDSGVFSIEWDAMDGIKGSSKKGARALDRVSVVWRFADMTTEEEVAEPEEGQPVPQAKPADWQGVKREERDLGLRVQCPESADVSRASSLMSVEGTLRRDEADGGALEGVRSTGPEGEDLARDTTHGTRKKGGGTEEQSKLREEMKQADQGESKAQ